MPRRRKRDAAARMAAERADAVDKSTKRVVYEVVLSEDSGNFKFGQAKLDDDSKAKIDELVAKILADPKGAYFEIEGHTDNVGSPDGNHRLGLQRGEAVKAYLYDAAQDSAAQDECDQLRRSQASREEQHLEGSGNEPPRRASASSRKRVRNNTNKEER